jgi:glycosyltransferase involved in cell wall biosynthesis
MRTFYHALDAYVTASGAEGMSNAILEAMASGLPILANDIPGHRELVRHGQNGLLVKDCAGDGLRDAIENAAALWRQEKLGAWAHASRSIAVEEYDMKDVCRRYAGIYRGLIAGPER